MLLYSHVSCIQLGVFKYIDIIIIGTSMHNLVPLCEFVKTIAYLEFFMSCKIHGFCG